MSHTYPIAKTVQAALSGDGAVASTHYEAEALCESYEIIALKTEWLTLSEQEKVDTASKLEASIAKGFVQVYEDANDQTVLAVTFWQMGAAIKQRARTQKTSTSPTKKARPKKARAKRKRYVDPNQLDLFDP
ncbi:MAG: hypothetical protein AAGG45_02260 [Pseudomonadota bacterium]